MTNDDSEIVDDQWQWLASGILEFSLVTNETFEIEFKWVFVTVAITGIDWPRTDWY